MRMTVTAVQIVLFVLLSANGVASNRWSQLSVQCLLEDAALEKVAASSERHCAMTAGSKIAVEALVLLQYDQEVLKCTLFLFQSVCQQLVAGQSPNCRVFLRSPVNPQLISPKFSSVWLGDSTTRFNNLVCQSDADMNRFVAMGGIQWNSAYGAQFDGQTGYLVMNKGNADFLGGITWLLRLKRQPQNQVLLFYVGCNEIATAVSKYTEIWEWDQARKLYASTHQIDTMPLQKYYTGVIMTQNAEDWVDIGFNTPPGSATYKFYYNGAFISDSLITKYNLNPSGPKIFNGGGCAMFGKRVGFNQIFNGTLRAIGVANVSLSESEIRSFFSTVT